MRKTHNHFFQANAMREVQTVRAYTSEKKLRGTRDTNINPRAFSHREVFHHQLYQTQSGAISSHGQKFFNINLTKEEKVTAGIGKAQMLESVGKLLQTHTSIPNGQKHKEQLQKVTHYFQILFEQVEHLDESNPIKASILGLNKKLEQFLSGLFEEVLSLQKKLIYSRKQPLHKAHQTSTLLANHFPESLPQLKQKLEFKAAKISNLQKSLSSYEFQNKKIHLLCQKLQEDVTTLKQNLKQKNKALTQLQANYHQIQTKNSNYEYRLKKLKQQLQVAHIIKEQNLADKLNYILYQS